MSSLEDLTDVQREQLQRTMFALLNDPKYGEKQKELIRESGVIPNYNPVELVVRDKVKEALDEPLKAMKAMQDDTEKAKQIKSREEAKARIEKRGMDFEKVEKLAVEKKIADYDTAADFMDLQSQAAIPTSSNINLVEPTEDVKKYLGNQSALNRARQTLAHEAVDEVLRSRRRA